MLLFLFPLKPGINTKRGIENFMKHETVTKESFKQGGWKAQYPKYRNISTPESRFYKHAAVLIPPKQLRQTSNGELQKKEKKKRKEKRKKEKKTFRKAKSLQETPLEHPLCSEVIKTGSMLDIPDLEQIGIETKRGQHKTSNKKDRMNENSD